MTGLAAELFIAMIVAMIILGTKQQKYSKKLNPWEKTRSVLCVLSLDVKPTKKWGTGKKVMLSLNWMSKPGLWWDLKKAKHYGAAACSAAESRERLTPRRTSPRDLLSFQQARRLRMPKTDFPFPRCIIWLHSGQDGADTFQCGRFHLHVWPATIWQRKTKQNIWEFYLLIKLSILIIIFLL